MSATPMYQPSTVASRPNARVTPTATVADRWLANRFSGGVCAGVADAGIAGIAVTKRTVPRRLGEGLT